MILLESAPIISNGPAWVIAVSAVVAVLKSLIGHFFPFLTTKYNYEACKKDCAAIREKLNSKIAEFDAYKLEQEESIRLIKEQAKIDNDKLIRAEVLMRALKIALNKKGYDDLLSILEEIISDTKKDE